MSSVFLPFSEDAVCGIKVAFRDNDTLPAADRLADVLSLQLEPDDQNADIICTGVPADGNSILKSIYADFDVFEYPEYTLIARVLEEKAIRHNRQLILRQIIPCAVQAGWKKGIVSALFHGAMLVSPENDSECTLVFGVSGMGKSTLASRWKTAEGIAPADDMLLIFQRSDGEFFARPLPTWSRYPERADMKRCFKVKKVLRLQRGDADSVVPASESLDWTLDCNKALMFHHYFPVLTQETVRKTAPVCMDFCEKLRLRFGTFDLRATLNGNIQDLTL